MISIRRRLVFELAGILLLGLVLHLWRLTTLPPGLDEDSAANGWLAVQWLRGGPFTFWNGRNGATEPLMVLLQTATTLVWGPSIFALRVVSAVALAGAPLALYAVMWEVGRAFPPAVQQWSARLAAVAMATSPALLEIGRTGLRATLLPLGVGVLAWLLLRALRGGGWRDYAASGVWLGLVGYTYLAARLLPVAVALFLLLQLVRVYADAGAPESSRRRFWQGTAWLVGGAGLVLLPQIFFFLQYPEAFWSRAGAVTLAQNPLAQTAGYGGVLLEKLIYMARMFGLEWWGQYNQGARPLFVPPVFVGFLVVWPLLWRARRVAGVQLLVILLPVMLAPDLLGGDRLEPHSLRVIGALLPAFGLAGLGLAWLMYRLHQRWRAARGAKRGKTWTEKLHAGLLWGVIWVALVGGWGAVDWVGFVQPRLSQSTYSWYAREDVALASWINAQTEPVLVPVYELSRPNLAYLTAARAGVPQGALAASSRPGAAGAGGWHPDLRDVMDDSDRHVWLVATEFEILASETPASELPAQVVQARPRVEASSYRYDPAALVLLAEGRAWLMPPRVDGVESCADPTPITVQAGAAVLPVAQVCRVALGALDWSVGALPGSVPAGYRFADDILLTVAHTDLATVAGEDSGADIAADRVADKSADKVAVDMIWQTAQPHPARWRMFVHIVDDQFQRIAGEDFMPAYGLYETQMWRPGAAIPLRQLVPLPPDFGDTQAGAQEGALPPGRYWLQVGLYDPLTGIRSPVASADGVPVEQARFGPLRVALPPQPPGFTGTPAAVKLGEVLRLHAYAVTPIPAADSEMASHAVRVDLRLEALAPPTQDYTFFVHVVDESGAIVAQSDAQPHNGQYPTGIWQAGEVVEMELTATVAPDMIGAVSPTASDATAGYTVWLGAYAWETGIRLPLTVDAAATEGAAVEGTDAPVIDDNRLRLTALTLP